MPIPTENVGSHPGRPSYRQPRRIQRQDYKRTVKERTGYCVPGSIKRMGATGSPVVPDGEQRASSFATYPLALLAPL